MNMFGWFIVGTAAVVIVCAVIIALLLFTGVDET